MPSVPTWPFFCPSEYQIDESLGGASAISSKPSILLDISQSGIMQTHTLGHVTCSSLYLLFARGYE